MNRSLVEHHGHPYRASQVATEARRPSGTEDELPSGLKYLETVDTHGSIAIAVYRADPKTGLRAELRAEFELSRRGFASRWDYYRCAFLDYSEELISLHDIEGFSIVSHVLPCLLIKARNHVKRISQTGLAVKDLEWLADRLQRVLVRVRQSEAG